MSFNLKIVMVIITLMYLFIIINAVKKRKLEASFSIFWIVIGILLIIAVSIPNFIDIISSFLGFEKPSNMLFCITIFVAFYLIFELNILLSKAFKRNVELVQEAALLEKRVLDLENKVSDFKK